MPQSKEQDTAERLDNSKVIQRLKALSLGIEIKIGRSKR